MVAVQAGCRIERALVLMCTLADESRITMDELATSVLDGPIHFD
jgi:hypothetical protein